MNADILPQGTSLPYNYLTQLAKLLRVSPNSPVFRRLARAHQLVDKVTYVDKFSYTVKSQTGSEESQVAVRVQDQMVPHSCTWLDFRNRWKQEGHHAQPCKHQYAVLLHSLQE